MILDPSMEARTGLPRVMVIIPKTTFGVLNFVLLSPHKCKLADGTSASADATKKNAPQRKVGSRQRMRGTSVGERRDYMRLSRSDQVARGRRPSREAAAFGRPARNTPERSGWRGAAGDGSGEPRDERPKRLWPCRTCRGKGLM